MEAIINFFTGTLNTVAWLYIFLPCTIVGGLYLTIRNRGIQFTRFGYAMKNTVGKMFQKQEAGAGAVTPLQAVTTALAATVGTGNIVGTSQAIALGGYGAVFWLWLAALLGMMIKYSEVTLSIQYRERDAKGDWVGGPMYYVKNGLGKHWQWVGILFCVFAAIASFGIGNMSQVNSIVGSLNDAIDAFIPAAEGERKLLNFVFGVAIAALIGVILFGGIKRIGAVAEKLVPVMSVLYIIFALIVWVVLQKTTFGYELKAVGLNKSAARYAGINEKKNIILSMAIAGALAGFGAGLYYLSNVSQWNPLNSTSLPTMGFNGISVALLASSNPIGTIFSAIFISHISVGGSFLSTKYYPTEISDLISGIIIYLCAFSMLFRGKIHALLFKNADKTNVNAEPAAPAKSATEKEGK